MPMNTEYNKLTQKLLEEGYTTKKYPEYVRINSSRFTGDDILSNLAGGFEYKQWYSDEIVYKTGCGKYVKGKKVLSNMSYQGISWSHENDNPVVRCPYDMKECPNNDKRLHELSGGGLCIICFCSCHSTTEVYEYENSIEKAEKERKEEKEYKYQEYLNEHNGRVCKSHMFYDEKNRTWHQRYEPERCANQCYSQNGYCPMLGRQLSKKRGNVYYDLKKSGIRHDDTLFNGEIWTHITKGIRFFDKPCSMDICEAFIKIQSEEILNKYMLNHSWEKMMDKSIEVEILNIRAETKPSRDLMKDLEDLKNGITITFDNDSRKQQEEYKKEKKKAAWQKKVEKLEEKLIEIGYWNMEPYSLDRIHADKWLGNERINELEEIRKQKIKEKQNEPIQLSLFEIETIGD